MQSRYTSPESRRTLTSAALLFCAALLPLKAQDVPPAVAPEQPAKPASELEKVYAELMSVQQKLQVAEQRAAAKPEVVAQREQFEAAVEEAMIEEEPEVEAKLEKTKELVQKLRESPDFAKTPDEQSPEFTADLTEFRSLQQELAVHRMEAIEKQPEVKAKGETLQKLFIKEMTKVEPDTPDLLAKRDALAERFEELKQAPAGS